jgi:hypothetical protein
VGEAVSIKWQAGRQIAWSSHDRPDATEEGTKSTSEVLSEEYNFGFILGIPALFKGKVEVTCSYP